MRARSAKTASGSRAAMTSSPRWQRRRSPAQLLEPDLVIVATKTTELDPALARLAGHWPAATVMTVQNGLGAEEIARRHGPWQLVSAVTFMSGTRHADTTSSTSSTRKHGSARTGRRRTRWWRRSPGCWSRRS